MLQSSRQNFHRSKMPALGAIVTVNMRPPAMGEKPRKFIVTAFPLCDNALPYSIGIHTCFVSPLDDRLTTKQIAAHWLEVIE